MTGAVFLKDWDCRVTQWPWPALSQICKKKQLDNSIVMGDKNTFLIKMQNAVSGLGRNIYAWLIINSVHPLSGAKVNRSFWTLAFLESDDPRLLWLLNCCALWIFWIYLDICFSLNLDCLLQDIYYADEKSSVVIYSQGCFIEIPQSPYRPNAAKPVLSS